MAFEKKCHSIFNIISSINIVKAEVAIIIQSDKTQNILKYKNYPMRRNAKYSNRQYYPNRRNTKNILKDKK